MLLEAAKEIFHNTLLKIDAGDAIRRAVRVEGPEMAIGTSRFVDPKLYVVSVGKAAYQMATAFDEIAGGCIAGGIISGSDAGANLSRFGRHWKTFAGGHPLPNEDSLAAARASIEMLRAADEPESAIVFLVSGGGSAMMELPAGDITLAELRSMNRVLVGCGAAISEINAVRRTISQVKGGGLAKLAPKAKQISLVISDTLPGDISSVASGPSIPPAGDIPDPQEVIEKYDLAFRLPKTVLDAVEYSVRQRSANLDLDSSLHVLLDNEYMLGHATAIAREMGFRVEIDSETADADIVEGCEQLVAVLTQHRRSYKGPLCLISGGEFACKVKGNGIGGRNLETVLRLALRAINEGSLDQWTVLSCGTDGIDGNSPAAGAAADETLLERAAAAGLNAKAYLEASDSFTFLDRLNTTIVTGATGTNVRDIRILLAN
jgi:glycerate 2-kinase